MDIHLTSRCSYYRSIDENDISACKTANHEKDVTSLWGKIADWFLGTKKEAAKLALFRLAHADTAAQQLTSFAELRQYVAPARQDSLTWQFSGNNDSVFKIGDCEIPCHSTTQEIVTEDRGAVNPDDVCRLLLSMKYTEHDVVCEFHHFAVGSLSDRNADSVLEKQNTFLDQTPALLGALRLIGLNQNDHQGNFAYDISQSVERMIYQITGDDDKSAIAARNAENLSILVSTPPYLKQS